MSELTKTPETVDKMPSSPESFVKGEGIRTAFKPAESGFIFPQSQQYQQMYMKTALQRHCAFYDRDCDGIITLSDTFSSLRA